ncbi:MAG: bifunctional phosphoribosyl-AMP cyclohydrolase/phosphoribosyl-ATP diphosphatase HisIE [Clostridiales bacterium]|nr:bifunctional phosphoribosyl-AMP cyclohydrolase/phosphoribosyl-ATP diphosphatase HisIE [Clostridiales bacterium]
MNYKTIIPCLYMGNGKAVTGFGQKTVFADGDILRLAKEYGNTGADELLIFDFSSNDAEHEEAIGWIKRAAQEAEVPIIGAGNVKRMEDVKKLLYAGCEKAVLNFSKESNIQILEEVSKKFGREKILVSIFMMSEYENQKERIEAFAGGILCLESLQAEIRQKTKLPVILHSNTLGEEEIAELLKKDLVDGISGSFVSDPALDRMQLKKEWKQQGISVNTFESRIAWSDFKKNSEDMIPVIVQDYKTDQVLMLAYMNEEAFQTTLDTGKMTYWSRSRKELWTKGMTSGHVQYVKSLTLDCDNDTILAKVSQVGAACHTGNRTCFFQELVKKPYDDTNPLRVFQEVYDVILDRKKHPKEGSYTNYLFDKGVDKILKKVGEECTEIVIAAKNPDKEEIKYEISDFLYHVMVLMAEKEVSWEDITRELARR